MTKLFYLLTFFALVFSGCSSKQYFEPEDTKSIDVDVKDIDSDIIDYNANGATLEDRRFISNDGISKLVLEENYKFLNKNNGTVLSSDDNASVNITKDGKTQLVQFKRNIVSASIENNLLAVGDTDNAISLYDLDSKKIVFKEYLKVSSINDIKISNPLFLNTIILFPTLDGKIVIVDKKRKNILKTINVDPKSDVNNIIFLKNIGDTLVAATPNKLFSFVNNQVKIKEYEIRSVVVKDKFIYISTLDGQIIKFDEQLNIIKSKKFKFAKFHTIGFGSYLYALESQGYLIKFDEDFKKIGIFDFSFDEEEKVFSIDDKLYFEDEYIILK